MKLKLNIVIVVLTCMVFGCRKEQANTPLKNIEFKFETSLDDWVTLGGSGERNDEDDIAISTDTMSEGDSSCKFTVSSTSIVSSGNRAELTFDQNAVEGDESWYEYSFFIPENYQDVLLNDNTGLVNWQVLGQWHHQPVTSEGEDWDSYTGENASPPIAVYYNYFDITDVNFQSILQNPIANSVYGFDPNWNEVSTISIFYGDNSIAINEINKGEWIRLKFNIKWSENNDGFIQVWKNGNELTDGKIYGANMLNKASHYFKFGLYRNPTIPYVNNIYFDHIKIWNDYFY
jgi:hypothetical protein